MTRQELEHKITELRAAVDVLKGLAAVQDMDLIDHPEWASSLTSQQREFMGMLIGAHPKALCRWDVLERLSGLDHVVERHLNCVNMIVRGIRKRIGWDAIETVPGGYRLGPMFRIRPQQAA